MKKLDVIAKSGALKDRAVVLDLKDYERALVWVDGRFSHILPPGLHAYWTTFREVTVEVIDARKVRFEHKDLQVIVKGDVDGSVGAADGPVPPHAATRRTVATARAPMRRGAARSEWAIRRWGRLMRRILAWGWWMAVS